MTYVTRYLRCNLCKAESTIDDASDSPVQMWMCRKCNKVSIREYRPDQELTLLATEKWKACPKGTLACLVVVNERGETHVTYMYDSKHNGNSLATLREAVSRCLIP